MQQSEDFALPAGGAVLAGDITGDGPALVCLHAGVADRRMFADQVCGLGDRFRILRYDRRGFGETTAVDEPFSHVEDLKVVLDRMGIEKAIFVGCSQGGRIAIDFALDHPQGVQALVLISSAVSGAPDATLPDDIAALDEAIDAADDAGELDRVNILEAHFWLDGPRSVEGRVGGPVRDLFLDMNGIALRHSPLRQERKRTDAYERLSDLRGPALLLHGARDLPGCIALHDHLAGIVPNTRVVACAESAHLPPMEEPDLVNREILAAATAWGLI